MSKRNILIAVIRIAAILVIVLPHGTVYQILDVNDRRERNIELSPYKQICCLCNRPAVYREYYKSESGILTNLPYYFCRIHYPPPQELEGKGRDRTSENFNPLPALAIFLFIYSVVTLRTIFYIINKNEKLKPTLWGAIFALIFPVAVMWYYSTL